MCPWKQTSVNFLSKSKYFHWQIFYLKVSSAKVAAILSRPQCVKENGFEHVICKMAVILLQSHWLNYISRVGLQMSQNILACQQSKAFDAWWKHAMETLSTLLVLCEGNPLVTSGFPSQMAQQCGDLLFLGCLPEQATCIKQTAKLPVIWGAMTLIWHHCNVCIFN